MSDEYGFSILRVKSRKEGYVMENERYVIGKDFNTKDWFVYDNETNTNICICDTEEEAREFVKNKCK